MSHSKNEDDHGSSIKKGNKRIFLNHVDEYCSKNLAKYLSKCAVGATLEDQDDITRDNRKNSAKKDYYLVYGTVKNDEIYEKPNYIKEIIQTKNKEELLEYLIESDIIIYDITQDPQQIDEACWAISILHSELERIDKPKTFVLISTAMTWAKTKPVDLEDTDLPFTEEDFRRRKAHVNYREHLAAEKNVIKFGKANKKKLATFVICSGLIYGHEESVFHFMFKSAWDNNDLNLYGTGKNYLPTIHINDLACVVQHVIDQKPKARYLIAVDDSKVTLKQITKAISKGLGTGKMKNVLKEDALLNKEITQEDFNMITIDLKMDAAFIKENMQIKWVAENGLVENITRLVKEYKASRNLVPFKVFILGPPGVGKTTIAQQLCREYKLHHIHAKDVINQVIDNLNKAAKRAETEVEKASDNEEDENEDEDEEDVEEEELPDLVELETINEQLENNNGRLDDALVIKFFKERLLSRPCQNQGFILDGFPKTREQAQALFETDEQEEEGEEDADDDSKDIKFNKHITPEIIIRLEANDDFLCNRIMSLPEKLIQDTHNTEEGFLRRLAEYREINNEEATIINVFEEEFELDVIKIPQEMIEEDKSFLHKQLIDLIKTNYLKQPRNYGFTEDEKTEMKKKEMEERILKEREAREEAERLELEEVTERVKKQNEWNDKLEQISREELEYVEAKSLPLRNYLMTHVMPTLTKGLIQCGKIKPEDPIDFLAEYLFKNNPQID